MVEQIPIASDISNILRGVVGKLKEAKETKHVDLELASDILKDFGDGTISLAECSVISLVRWANLGGAQINEENVSLNMRQLFSKVSSNFKNEMSSSLFKNADGN